MSCLQSPACSTTYSNLSIGKIREPASGRLSYFGGDGEIRKIERFIESVKGLPELITEFDESLWAGLVDSMTVHGKDRIVFRLMCGMEMEA